MELGILTDSLVKPLLLWSALGSLILGVVLVFLAISLYQKAESKMRRENALFNTDRQETHSLMSALYGWLATGMILSAIVLVITGALQDAPGTGCRGEGNASPGLYKIVDATLVYNQAYETIGGNYVRNENGSYKYEYTPSHFELQLEGRADPSHDVKIVRCIEVPYPQVEGNYTFLQQNPSQKRTEIKTSPLATKVAGGWWKLE